MTRVLGIDPGSAATGWALVIGEGNRYSLESSGVIRTGKGSRAERLALLQSKLLEVVDRLNPQAAAVETPFTGRNPRSALALAESRGVILATLGTQGVPVFDYPPAEVKSTIVGNGRAEKQQVVFMVVRLLGLDRNPPQDAADAMAIAMTHIQLHRWRSRQSRALGHES